MDYEGVRAQVLALLQQEQHLSYRVLKRLQNEQVRQLEWRLEKQLEQVRRSQFERRSQVIRRVFDEYRQWVEETLSTEPEPYLQVLAAVCGSVAHWQGGHVMADGGGHPQPSPRLPSRGDCYRLLHMVE